MPFLNRSLITTYCFKKFQIGIGCGKKAPGSGGRGGRGGNGGNVHIVGLFDNGLPVSVITVNGINGKDGVAGKAEYKERELGAEFNQARRIDGNELTYTRYWQYELDKIRSTDKLCFQHIRDGGNTHNQKEPENAEFDAWVAISEYLSMLRVKQLDHIYGNELRAFANRILNDRRVLATFTMQGGINHLQLLEQQLLEYKDRVDFAPYYLAVSQGVEIYAENHANLTKEQQKVSLNTFHSL